MCIVVVDLCVLLSYTYLLYYLVAFLTCVEITELFRSKTGFYFNMQVSLFT